MPAARQPRKDLLLDMPATSRISWVAIDYGRLEVNGHALLLMREDGAIEIPAGAFASLLLEPGTSVTHEAVRLCAENSVQLIWVGEAGARIYAAANVHANAGRITAQANVSAHKELKIEAARRLYSLMFDEVPPPSYSIEKLRGIEGSKVKKIYQSLAEIHRVAWDGRQTPSALQQAISFANGCLYSLSEVAIVMLGYSPAIGVVHSGDPRSFVYDLADSVKFSSLIPKVFEWHRSGSDNSYADIRRRCRDHFKEYRVLDTLLKNADWIIDGNGCGHSQ